MYEEWELTEWIFVDKCIHPEWDTRPKVGLKPTTPQRAAGIRTDPKKKLQVRIIYLSVTSFKDKW